MGRRLEVANFDLLSFLEDHNVSHTTHGKNISPGWVGLQCPWCDDSSTHLGISLKTKQVNCWRCGGHRITDFIQEVVRLTYGEALDLLQEYILEEEIPDPVISRPGSFRVPQYFTPLPQPHPKPIFQELVNRFLIGRGLPPEQTCRQWNFYWGGALGPYKFRIILPVFQYEELVSFTSRDITGQAFSKYKALAKDKGKLPLKSTLFNLDSVKNRGNAVICEGPFDVIKLGPGAIATFGTSWSQTQVDLLREKKLKKAFILFDNEPEAQRRAEKLGEALWFIDSIEILCLKNKKDPGELSLEEARYLMKNLV